MTEVAVLASYSFFIV